MIAILDVHYAPTHARVACVLARDWADPASCEERTKDVTTFGAYEPGNFRARELPPLLALLADLPARPQVVVVDGYVWLDAAGKAGLGGHLHAALGGDVAVVGVAKTRFRGAPALEVVRGASARPLFVTSAGLDPAVAASHVARMHGAFRLPTLLGRADRLSRGG
jgi:deoxyribonuclease V